MHRTPNPYWKWAKNANTVARKWKTRSLPTAPMSASLQASKKAEKFETSENIITLK